MNHKIIIEQALASSGGVIAILCLIWFFAGDNLAYFVVKSEPMQNEINSKLLSRVGRVEADLERLKEVIKLQSKDTKELNKAILDLKDGIYQTAANVAVLSAQIESQNDKLNDTSGKLERLFSPTPPQTEGGGR